MTAQNLQFEFADFEKGTEIVLAIDFKRIVEVPIIRGNC